MNIDKFFDDNPRLLLAFSGDAGSLLLLSEALRRDLDVLPVYVRTAFAARDDFEKASESARSLGAPMSVIDLDILADPDICANGDDCFLRYAHRLYAALASVAGMTGYPVIVDGSALSGGEDREKRHFLRQSLGVRSPLYDAGMTEDDIRHAALDIGLNIADHSQSRCLADRIARGQVITLEKLAKAAAAEKVLRESGLKDFSISISENDLNIECIDADREIYAARQDDISANLNSLFDRIFIDSGVSGENRI